VWIKVEQVAGACHTGRRSCFYRAVPLGKSGDRPSAVTLVFRGEKVFDPKAVYRK
jgi:phosphoribosyl-AMP cyclohydrolase